MLVRGHHLPSPEMKDGTAVKANPFAFALQMRSAAQV
jgi:hypothetical protein